MTGSLRDAAEHAGCSPGGPARGYRPLADPVPQAGDLQLRIPKLRVGSYFPSLLERRRRIDQAPFAVVMEVYVHGVSTRKVDALVEALHADAGASKSEVSRVLYRTSAFEVAAFRDGSCL